VQGGCAAGWQHPQATKAKVAGAARSQRGKLIAFKSVLQAVAAILS
jgi:hypothetical protein